MSKDNETKGARAPLVFPPELSFTPKPSDLLVDIAMQVEYLNKRLSVLEENKIVDKLRDLTSRMDAFAQALKRIDTLEQQLSGNAVLNKRDNDKIAIKCDTLASEINDAKDSLRKTCERLNIYADKVDKMTLAPFAPEAPDVKDRDTREILARISTLEKGTVTPAPKTKDAGAEIVVALTQADLAGMNDSEWCAFYDYMARMLTNIRNISSFGTHYDKAYTLWVSQFMKLYETHRLRNEVNTKGA